MTKRIIWVALAVAAFAGSNAMAQESVVEHLVKACESDIKNYCSQVTPGEGRLLHCMAAHEDKISGQCEYALYQAATLMEQMAAAISYVAKQCETEFTTICRGVQAGEGRLLSCLDANAAEVSDGCKQAVADTVTE